jgi:hypothetical protein
VERWWHVHRIREFDHPSYFAGGIDVLPIPYPPSREPPRIGVLHWPTGASRWATCHLLATGDQLARVQRVAGSSLSLVISDGSRSVTAPMYRLGARPVSQRGDGHELYLLTLVDDRYWWWYAGNGALSLFGSMSWPDLLSTLFTDLGVDSPTIDTIDAGYGSPDPARWSVGTQPIPLLIDAVCKTVGLRCTRSLGGSVRCINYTNAAAADSSQWTTYKYEVIAGGRAANSEAALGVPAAVAVRFVGPGAYQTTKSLADLAIPDFGGATGAAGKVGAVAADPLTLAPVAQQLNYVTPAATDYFRWQLSLTDATFRGVRNWAPTGLEDCLEWVSGTDDILTRVLRSRIHDPNSYRPDNDCPETGTDSTTGGLADFGGIGSAVYGVGTYATTELLLGTLPKAGLYLIWGNVFFRAKHSSTGPAYLVAFLYDKETGFDLPGTAMISNVPVTNLEHLESKTFTTLHQATCDNTRLGIRVGVPTLGSGSWTYVYTYGDIDSPVIPFFGNTTEMGHLLLCPAPTGSCASGSCNLPGWGGAGWYCVLDNQTRNCIATELLEGDQCDPSIVICSGPYADQATANTHCPSGGSGGSGGSGPITVDLTSLGCPGGQTSCTSASISVSAGGNCDAGFLGDGLTLMPTAVGSNTLSVPGGWNGLQNGLEISFGGGSNPNPFIALYIDSNLIPIQFQDYFCNGAGPITVQFTVQFFGSPCSGVCTYTITLNP